MIKAASFIEPLRSLKYSQYAGVPCSFLKPFINYVIADPTLNYVGATSEGEAVGITFGAYLAGRKSVTMCQNSGLGNMVNPLTSLNYPFRVPTLLIVTWRGEPGVKDEPQHEQMGRILHRLLDTLEIPWLPFPKEDAEIPSAIQRAETSMQERQRPFAFVMSQDTVEDYELSDQNQPTPVVAEHRRGLRTRPEERLTRSEALQLILESLAGDEAIIATTGKTGRELFTVVDRPNHLYVVGGMGTASAIGFGVAQALPKQPVVVIDGDGAALMKLGSLTTIGYHQPANFLHVVLDNESHDSTGGQRTSSGIAQFAAIAAAANYRQAFAADGRDEVRDWLKLLRHRAGPSFLHVKIRPGSPKHLGRPSVKPHEVKDRFMAFLRSHGQGLTESPMKEPRVLPTAKDKTLFTPGPLTTSLTVKQAMLRDIGSRDDALLQLLRDIRVKLLTLGGVTREDGFEAILMQGSGTFGVESVLSSVIPPKGQLLVLTNGAYGERIVKMASVLKIGAVVVRCREDETSDPELVVKTLSSRSDIRHVAVVHCETTTGILNPIEEIGRRVKALGRDFIVDAMSSFGAVPVDLKAAQIDYLISSANKCIEGVPGFSFVIARREPLLASEGCARSMSLDLLGQLKGFEENGQFRFTPPTHVLLAFDQALRELDHEGGVAGRAARYRRNHEVLMQGMSRLGFRAYLDPSRQSHIVTAFHYPDDSKFDFADFYRRLRDRGMIIYPGKVSQVNSFRIGCIGRIFESDVRALLGAIGETLEEMGVRIAG